MATLFIKTAVQSIVYLTTLLPTQSATLLSAPFDEWTESIVETMADAGNEDESDITDVYQN